MDLQIKSLDELANAAANVMDFAASQNIFLFYGNMGAGKTTLIKALCKCLGSTDNVTSPTFAIVNEYTGAKNNICHFDFYRLKKQSEALDIGFEEYLYSGRYCFIEWPEKIPGLLPEHYTSVKIQVLGDGARRLSIENI